MRVTAQQLGHIAAAFAHAVLHIAAWLARHARKRQSGVHQIGGQFGERAEVGQLFGLACAEEQHQFSASGFAGFFQAAAMLGHGAHRG